MNPQILLAVDDENLNILLGDYLRSKNFVVDSMTGASEAIASVGKQHYDFCLLLLREVQMQVDVINTVRCSCTTPIYAFQREFDKSAQLAMYEAGADVCMTLPVVPDLLICQMNALLKRKMVFEKNLPTQFSSGNVSFDSVLQLLTIDDETVSLSAKESSVLLLLWRHESQLVDRSLILKTVWQADNYFNSRSLSVYINHLRKRFADTESVKIMSIHGRGYKLIASAQ